MHYTYFLCVLLLFMVVNTGVVSLACAAFMMAFSTPFHAFAVNYVPSGTCAGSICPDSAKMMNVRNKQYCKKVNVRLFEVNEE